MSDRKRKASDSEEPVCVLCHRVDVDPNICGDTLSASGICVHEFCLAFANIVPGGMRIENIPPAVIRRAVKQANQKQCFVCGERGAAISCAVSSCERSFHLRCAMDGECVTQFFGQHRSYCWEHRPSQEIEEAPAEGTNCLICFEPVGDTLSYHTMQCPACAYAWYHRGCVQQLALNTGALSFQCPCCRNVERFFIQMAIHGIHIPLRPPSWEANDAYASLRERHRRCDVSNCLNPRGREQVDTRGPWQLFLCSSCAAEGTHRRCSSVLYNIDSWECDSCAGVGTASSTNTELAGPSSASQEGLRPSHSSSVPEDVGSGSTSQAAGGPSPSSQLPGHSGQPSEAESELCAQEDQDFSEQHRGHQRSRQTPAPGAESSSQTSTRQSAAEGTHRHCSSLLCTTDSWESDSCAGVGTASSTNTELAGPSSASQEGLRPSHSSSVPENVSSGSTSQAAEGPSPSSQLPGHSGQPSEVESELCAQEDQDFSGRHRGRQRSRRTPAPGAESSSQTSTRRRASGSCTESPAAAPTVRPRRRRSGRTRSRSPLHHQASSPQSRPRGQRGRRQMPSRESSLPEDRQQPRQQGRSRTRSHLPVGR